MKPFYAIIMYLIIFQMVLLIVGSLGIFPNTFYSDFDTETFRSYASTPQGMISYLFVPDSALQTMINTAGGGSLWLVPALVSLFLFIGSLISILTKSFVPISIAIVGLLFVPMVTKSYKFLNQLFSYGDSQALIYMGVLFGILILVIAIITIVEMPTQGRS